MPVLNHEEVRTMTAGIPTQSDECIIKIEITLFEYMRLISTLHDYKNFCKDYINIKIRKFSVHPNWGPAGPLDSNGYPSSNENPDYHSAIQKLFHDVIRM